MTRNKLLQIELKLNKQEKGFAYANEFQKKCSCRNFHFLLVYLLILICTLIWTIVLSYSSSNRIQVNFIFVSIVPNFAFQLMLAFNQSSL